MLNVHPLILMLALIFANVANGTENLARNQAIVSAYSASWNTKNIEKMASLMHPNIQWLSVNGNDIKVEISGKPALVAEMKKWFAGTNLPHGKLSNWSINGNYLAVTETASWRDKSDKLQSQSALTVYELEGELIRRVYYYPSVKN